MCTLLPMVYGLFKQLIWLTHVTCSYMFKENVLLFNVHLGCFVDFILCPTDKYMFKVNNKKIRLICWMCRELKINKAWHSSIVFIDLDRHSITAYQYTVSTFHFEQVFVGKVWKTSHKRYVCFVIKVSRPISVRDLSLHQIEINYEQMTIIWACYKHSMNICDALHDLVPFVQF